MSEQNILNPTVTSALNPDYAIKITDPQVVSRWQARSGKPYFRRLAARAEVFDMTWGKRMFADYLTLLAWVRQYESDYFSFIDWDRGGRYYTGMFADQPTYSRDANNQVTITAQFVAVPTLPMFQYPSNWAQDAIFLEERAGFGDLVKLTRSIFTNYLLWSQDFENAAWALANITLTADTATAPDGTNTADKIAATATGVTSNQQGVSGVGSASGNTYSIYAKQGSGATSANNFVLRNDSTSTNILSVSINYTTGALTLLGGSGTFTSVNAGNGWWRIELTCTSGISNGDNLRVYAAFIGNSETAGTFALLWGAQLEQARNAGPYVFTTTAAATGFSATGIWTYVSDPKYHGGAAYTNPGTDLDAAEWSYFGYGFQLYAYKGPDQGIIGVYLDNVLQSNVDLYAAAPTNSAVVLTETNVALGIHRVKLAATLTKNASSSAFNMNADAIQVMR